ncbi:hypothetical protein AB4144_21215 [Rhizobiaceae sp. 2RAB30]
MDKVVLFRGRTAAFVRTEVRAANLETTIPAKAATPARLPKLVAIWRHNSASRRLECRWVDGGPAR